MNYVLFNEDGSILKEHIEYYVMKGDTNYTSYFFSRPDFKGSDIAIAYFTLPSGETTTIACQWKEQIIDEVAYLGWEFTLNETTTYFSGVLYVSLQITRSNNRYLTYPLAIVVNDTGYSPFADSGLTIEEVNSYLKQIQQYQIKYDINNVRGYKSMEEVYDLEDLVVGQLVCVDAIHYYVALNSEGKKYLKVLSVDEGSPLIFDNHDIAHISGYKEVGNAKNQPYTLEDETDKTIIEGYGNFSYGFNNKLYGIRNVAFGNSVSANGKHNLVGGEYSYISQRSDLIYENPHECNIVWGQSNVISFLGGVRANAIFGSNNSLNGGANNLIVGSFNSCGTLTNAAVLGTYSTPINKDLLVVGNGTQGKRYNVFEITKDNEIYVDNVEIAKTLTSKENNDLTKYDFAFYKPKNTDTTATNEFKSMPVSIAWNSDLDKYDFTIMARDNLGHSQVVAPSTYVNDTHDNCVINKGWLLTYIKNNILPKFGGLFVYKGQKQKYSDLPKANENTVGDTWNVVESAKVGSITYPAGSNFVWNGTSWDALGGEQAITQEDLDKKLDKVSSNTSGYERVYAITANGSQQMLNVDTEGSYNSVAKRTQRGFIVCDYIPNVDNQLANKKYVDQMSGFTLREWE